MKEFKIRDRVYLGVFNNEGEIGTIIEMPKATWIKVLVDNSNVIRSLYSTDLKHLEDMLIQLPISLTN